MASRFFWTYGKFCATHPWEMIIATLTLTTCLLTWDHQQPPLKKSTHQECDLIVMTLIRCSAVLFSYHQFRRLRKLDSKYILVVAGLFAVCSSLVFTSVLMEVLVVNVSHLKDALFVFFLLIDLSKTALLAQFALTATTREELERNIAQALSLLGPSMTLDTIVTTLVISVGLLSGVHRLEVLSCFACLAVLVNYIVFITFYPACLSLTLGVSRASGGNFIKKDNNPVVERVKLIMSVGLVVVHTHKWLAFKKDVEDAFQSFVLEEPFEDHGQWSYGNVVVLTLLVTLIVFECKNDQKQSCFKTQTVFALNEEIKNKEVQTDSLRICSSTNTKPCFEDPAAFLVDEDFKDFHKNTTCRSLQDCLTVYQSNLCANDLTDEEVILLVKNKTIALYEIEKVVNNPERAVQIRRKLLGVQDLPYKSYDYSKIMNVCCENVIGYVPIPLGVAGPLFLDNQLIYVPMATTEGCLIASTNRGCRALLQCGVKSNLIADGMTRGPVVRFCSAIRATEVMLWLEQPQNFAKIKASFDTTSNYARLIKLRSRIAGRLLFIRFVATTGDAMGMNMLCKGTEAALTTLHRHFPDLEIVSLSGNFCTDKKPSAINWLEGRGKSVVCETVVPQKIVTTILKTTPEKLIDVNTSKNLIGSAMAGSIGGFNAHAANIVTAVFIATGQDPAQNVGSSNCITLMEARGADLYVSCTMPSIEVGTVGGGTGLPAQAACLEMLGAKGANVVEPGANSGRLARIVCGAVLAGELSLMAALASGDLVKSHLRHNRYNKDRV